MSDEGPDDMLPSTSTRGLDTSGHRLEFMIGDNVLPYEMTVYQAVQQFGSTPTMFDLTTEDSDSRNNSVMMYGSPGIWARIHTIYYRPVTTGSADGSNSSQSTSQSKIFKMSNKFIVNFPQNENNMRKIVRNVNKNYFTLHTASFNCSTHLNLTEKTNNSILLLFQARVKKAKKAMEARVQTKVNVKLQMNYGTKATHQPYKIH